MIGKSKRRWVILGTAAALALAALFYPVDSLTVPRWKVQVFDSIGRPLKSLPLRQAWQNYAAETDDHQAAAATDDKGIVILPARYASAPLIMRLVTPLMKLATHGVAVGGASSWIVQQCDLIELGDKPAVYTGGELQHSIRLGYLAGISPYGVAQKLPECAALEAQAKEADRLK